MSKFDRNIGGLISGSINPFSNIKTNNSLFEGIRSPKKIGDVFEDVVDTIDNTLDKLELIFTDVDLEGAKRGYSRAAKEYNAAYERIKNEYSITEQMLDQEKINKEIESDRLISKLQQLEEVKSKLENQINCQLKQVSNKYQIPVSTISVALYSGNLLTSGSEVGLIDYNYNYKSKKMKEAEEKGYREARNLHMKKIRELSNNLRNLKEKKDAELQKLVELITDAIKEIADVETKIAELRIVLNS